MAHDLVAHLRHGFDPLVPGLEQLLSFGGRKAPLDEYSRLVRIPLGLLQADRRGPRIWWSSSLQKIDKVDAQRFLEFAFQPSPRLPLGGQAHEVPRHEYISDDNFEFASMGAGEFLRLIVREGDCRFNEYLIQRLAQLFPFGWRWRDQRLDYLEEGDAVHHC